MRLKPDNAYASVRTVPWPSLAVQEGTGPLAVPRLEGGDALAHVGNLAPLLAQFGAQIGEQGHHARLQRFHAGLHARFHRRHVGPDVANVKADVASVKADVASWRWLPQWAPTFAVLVALLAAVVPASFYLGGELAGVKADGQA